jgi:hypothetical protein
VIQLRAEEDHTQKKDMAERGSQTLALLSNVLEACALYILLMPPHNYQYHFLLTFLHTFQSYSSSTSQSVLDGSQ